MQAREWLVLFRLPGVGSRQLAAIAERSPAWPQGWLAALPGEAATALRLWLDHPARSPLATLLEADLAWLAADPARHLLHAGHPAWPDLLGQIADPPPVLWALGDLEALSPPRLAMVGTRRPTREGLGNATAFARELAGRGWCVVSGMALGIDGAAQQAALDAGGRSVAVLGCGVDLVYPPRHHRLYRRLQAPGGLLLSEHPPGTLARPGFFPRRNRIVTGLSLGVLVVEAAEKSGSLVSARLATEQGREEQQHQYPGGEDPAVVQCCGPSNTRSRSRSRTEGARPGPRARPAPPRRPCCPPLDRSWVPYDSIMQ